MEIEDPILNFLAQPENLEVAMDAAHNLEKLRDYCHAAFWPALHAEFAARMRNSPYQAEWFISEPHSNHLASYAQIHIEPKAPTRQDEFLEISFEQGTLAAKYPLYYCIIWTNRQAPSHFTPEWDALQNALSRQGPKLRGNPIFELFVSTGYTPRSDAFLRRMTKDHAAFIKELVDKVWQLFTKNVDLLNAVNRATAARRAG
jgi:hypothetical protein